MMNIISHTIEKLEDPTGILTGERYEIILNIEVPEDDELYSENGVYVKLIFVMDHHEYRIAQYHFYEQLTNQYLDFELEDDEKAMIIDYCKQQLTDQ